MKARKIYSGLLLAGSALALAGCGSSTTPPAMLTIEGYAFIGSMPVAGSVMASCKVGGTISPVKTNSNNGFYTVYLSGGQGPCLLKLTPTATTSNPSPVPLYSVTLGTAAANLADINPLTNLFVDYLASFPLSETGAPTTTAGLPAETWFNQTAAKDLLSNTTANASAQMGTLISDFDTQMTTLLSGVANPNANGVTVAINSPSFLQALDGVQFTSCDVIPSASGATIAAQLCMAASKTGGVVDAGSGAPLQQPPFAAQTTPLSL